MHGPLGEQGQDRGADIAASTPTAASVASMATVPAMTAVTGAEWAESVSAGRERRPEAAKRVACFVVHSHRLAADAAPELSAIVLMVEIHDQSFHRLFSDVSTIYR